MMPVYGEKREKIGTRDMRWASPVGEDILGTAELDQSSPAWCREVLEVPPACRSLYTWLGACPMTP